MKAANELILKAASGLATDPKSVGPVRVGEGVSGEVIDTGKAVMVTDLRTCRSQACAAGTPVQDKLIYQLSDHDRWTKGRRSQCHG